MTVRSAVALSVVAMVALAGRELERPGARRGLPRSGEPRAFVVDDALKVGRDGRFLSLVELPGYLDANPAWDGRSVDLAGARGETVAFQVLVRAGREALRGVDVSLAGLEGAGRITLFREWYLPVTVPSTSPGGSAGPGEYPDARVRADTPGWGLPVDVPMGLTQGIWIDVAIPREVAGGRYRGTLTVRADGRELARWPVSLMVYEFALPVERHLAWRAGYSGWEEVPQRLGVAEGSEEWLRMERDLYRLLWEEHRLVPTTHYQDVAPPVAGSPEAPVIDWTLYDRRFGPYLAGSAFADGRPLPIFSLPVNLHRGWPVRLRDDPSAAELVRIEAVARLVARHWDEKGWRLGDAFAYVADEPGPERMGAVARACDAIRRGDPRIRTSVAFYEAFGAEPMRWVEDLAGRVSSWEIAADRFDGEARRALQGRGDAVGVYQGGEPYVGGEALDDDGLALVTWPWIAWRHGLDHLFLYNVTEWDYARVERSEVPWKGRKREIWENPLNQSWPTNSQGVLVYPGTFVGVRGVVPSIRLKQVRRGLQDYEYLHMVERAGRRGVAEAVASRIVPISLDDSGPRGRIGPRGAWERDPRTWDAARRELAGVIARRPGGP
jgi:hypothetical protein